jgi:deazaflavin-dependent oxidoreductase (nitroreductase family)
MQAFASTRPGAWVFAKTLRHFDDAVGRLSRGRLSAPEVLAGLPVIDVTTIGRKSGLRRPTHLISVPIADTLALLGTNFGQPATPAWVLNLEADPHASVTFRGSSRDVVARAASATEYAEVMASSASLYGGYRKYQQRITGRRVRIFVLEPA